MVLLTVFIIIAIIITIPIRASLDPLGSVWSTAPQRHHVTRRFESSSSARTDCSHYLHHHHHCHHHHGLHWILLALDGAQPGLTLSHSTESPDMILSHLLHLSLGHSHHLHHHQGRVVLLLWRSSAEHSEGHPVYAPIHLHV